ncbi:MAG TPA: jacalin-like lectin [Blastocatellia bacterium]
MKSPVEAAPAGGAAKANIAVAVDNEEIRSETWGGSGGIPFSDDNIPSGSSLKSLNLRHGSFVDYLQADYTTEDGTTISMPGHGGDGGAVDSFVLEPGEYLTGIRGRCGQFVNSITFLTNRRKSGVYGGAQRGPNHFEYTAPEGFEIIGFWGGSAKYVDRIGVIVRHRQEAGR